MGGAGKNVLPYVQNGAGSYGVTVAYDADEEAYILNGTATFVGNILLGIVPSMGWTQGERYTISAEKVSGSMTLGSGTGITYAISLFSSNSQNYIRGNNLSMTDITGYVGNGIGFDATNAQLILQSWREGTVFDNLKIKIQIEAGSTATAWTPYSNICPISGRDSVDAYVTGVNLFDKNNVFDGYIDDADGGLKGTAPYKSTHYIRVNGGSSYYVKSEQTSSMRGAWYDENKNFVSGVTSYANSIITAPSNATYVRLTIASNAGGSANTFAVNYPSTDTEYHPYNGDTYHTDLGRTVYGGTLDVVSGELVVDRAMRTFDGSSDEVWGVNSTPKGYAFNIPNLAENKISQTPLSNCFAGVSPRSYINLQDGECALSTSPHNYTNFLTNVATTVAEWRTHLASNPLQAVYELATPTTVQLTPQEVKLLLGNNTIWSDGDVAIVYSADVTKWIASHGGGTYDTWNGGSY